MRFATYQELDEDVEPYRQYVVSVRDRRDGRPRLYIGRDHHDKERGQFGNPHTMNGQSEGERRLVIEAFYWHLCLMDVNERRRLCQIIRDHVAVGGVLECFCAPRPCHGHVWVWWAFGRPNDAAPEEM